MSDYYAVSKDDLENLIDEKLKKTNKFDLLAGSEGIAYNDGYKTALLEIKEIINKTKDSKFNKIGD